MPITVRLHSGVGYRTVKWSYRKKHSQMAEKKYLPMFVVYENPRDIPGKFVVREWRVFSQGKLDVVMEPLAIEDTLQAALSKLPPGLTRLNRSYFDDPVIVEVWL